METGITSLTVLPRGGQTVIDIPAVLAVIRRQDSRCINPADPTEA